MSDKNTPNKEEEIVVTLKQIEQQNDKIIALLENIYRVTRETYLCS